MKKYLVIIPARGGSKGIPKKNIVDVAGRPLIAYSIDVANKLLSDGYVQTAIVSTDSKEIVEVARSHNACVPFLRPQNISDDKAKSVDFMLHAIDYYKNEGVEYDATILLQPTSPLRTTNDVVEAIRIFEETEAESLISVYREDYICDLVCYHKKDNLGVPLNKKHNAGVRRQEHDKFYVRNGAIYITDVNYLINEQKIISDNPAIYVMPKNKSVNLDTKEDLEFLKWILR